MKVHTRYHAFCTWILLGEVTKVSRILFKGALLIAHCLTSYFSVYVCWNEFCIGILMGFSLSWSWWSYGYFVPFWMMKIKYTRMSYYGVHIRWYFFCSFCWTKMMSLYIKYKLITSITIFLVKHIVLFGFNNSNFLPQKQKDLNFKPFTSLPVKISHQKTHGDF